MRSTVPDTVVGIALLMMAGGSVVALALPVETAIQDGKVETMTKIRMKVDGGEIIATLNAGAAASDFLALLPLALTLSDYHKTEKVSDLPKRLSTVGDITYYAPWGNLAIFYRDFGYASGLVHLGVIESGQQLLEQKGAFEVTIEPMN